MLESTCPYCGEPTSVEVDTAIEGAQSFVTDCEVCCKPIQFRARFDSEGDVYLEGRRDDE
jgi:transcription elongation factor Elf1